MATVQSHLDNISINISLESAGAKAAGFGTVLLLVDQATGNTLDSARVVTYATADEAVADNTAGFISAATLSAVQKYFSQVPQPENIKVGRVDTAGAETYLDGYTAVKAVDEDFYGVAIDRRADADILLISAQVETENRIFMLQSDDADWKTSGLPAGLAALATRENSVVVYHDDDTAWNDVGYLGARLVFDPDVQSAGWNAQVRSITALAALTQAEKDFLDGNNANHGLPFGPAVMFMDPGLNCAGRPIDHIVTAHWFEARLQEAVATEVVRHADRGEKITVTPEGQAKIASLVLDQFDIGVAAGHFVAGQTEVTPQPITSADRSAGRIRINGRATLAVNAREYSFNFAFGLDPLFETT